MRLEELVNRYYSHLSVTDKEIWDYIKQHKAECSSLPIEELALRCHVSRTTILRFAQRISLRGYSELKTYLRLELSAGFAPRTNITKAAKAYGELIKQIRDRDCTGIFNLLDGANRLFVYGSGIVQSTVAKEVKRSFMNLGKVVYDIGANNESGMIGEMITSKDCMMIISLSGESEHVRNFVKTMKMKQVPVISVTLMEENTLARMSDESLFIDTVVADSQFYEAYRSLAGFFILMDLLSIKYLDYQEEKKRGSGR